MKKSILFLLLILFPLTAYATGPILPTKGTVCWIPNLETDIAAYKIYLTGPTGIIITIDAGKPATAPVPPNPSQTCTTGKIGMIRDQTGQADGQYSVQITATNTSSQESAKSTPFPFMLDKTLNLTAPVAPTGLEVK